MTVTVRKAAILGAGQFGFAIAKLLGDNNPDIQVFLYDPVEEIVEKIKNTSQHPYFHKGCVLNTNVTAVNTTEVAVKDAELIVLAIPGQYLRGACKNLAPLIKVNEVIVLNVAKAVEKGTNELLHNVVEQEFANVRVEWYFAALAGGMIAEEVTTGAPIAANIACTDPGSAELLQHLFETETFLIRPLLDVVGVEMAGAFKNVVAIGAGFFDGLGYDISSKSAYVSEASKEMSQLALELGADPTTFALGTHAWLGDLLTTCFGQSRNRLLGEFIGSGLSVKDSLEKLHSQRKISEGYFTTQAFHELAVEKGLQLPILAVLKEVLFEDLPVEVGITKIFSGLSLAPKL
eukprot:TRINITY_DN3963_c0_g1_i1.p1 TRINITY_DN3963_c0_g1~~TRINITY_DN3963_c0_g1_i1.p1  ORF type:complete len:360 (+),score=95.26 TRINITY_DN3963_c0_g1_i1:42-1082(+)